MIFVTEAFGGDWMLASCLAIMGPGIWGNGALCELYVWGPLRWCYFGFRSMSPQDTLWEPCVYHIRKSD